MSSVSLGKCVVPELTRSKMRGPWSGVGVYTFRDSEIAEWRHHVVFKCTGLLFPLASHFLVKAQEGAWEVAGRDSAGESQSRQLPLHSSSANEIKHPPYHKRESLIADQLLPPSFSFLLCR